jgi:mRNA interferase MazF
MNPGDVVLARLPQVGGGPPKLRPALLLAVLPGAYQKLFCGISTQWQQIQANWDELIYAGDVDFPSSGLRHDSVIRLSFLVATEAADVKGIIGRIDLHRLERLRTRLADHLRP